MRGSAKSGVREQDGSEVGGEDLARNTLITCSVLVASASHPLSKKGIIYNILPIFYLKLANLYPNLACTGSKIAFWEVHLGMKHARITCSVASASYPLLKKGLIYNILPMCYLKLANLDTTLAFRASKMTDH